MGSNALRFLRPDLALGVSRRDLQKRLGFWLVNQHGAQWRDLGNTQSRFESLSRDLILRTREKCLTFNRVQSKVVIGLLRVIKHRGGIFTY